MDGCGGAALGDKAVRCWQIKPSAGSSWTCLCMHVLPLRSGAYILSRRPYLHVQTPPYLLQSSVRRCPKVREGAAKCGYGSAAKRSAPPRCSLSLRVYESSVGRLEPYWKSHLDTHTHTCFEVPSAAPVCHYRKWWVRIGELLALTKGVWHIFQSIQSYVSIGAVGKLA